MQSDIHRVRALGKAGVADPREIGDDARAYARLVGVLPEVAVVPRASGRCARGVPLSGNFKGRQKAMTSTKTNADANAKTSTKTNSKTRRLPLHLDATLAKARSEQQHAVRQVIVRADPGSRLLDEHRRVHQHAHGSSRSITFNGEYLMETMTAGGNGDDDGDQQSLGKAGSVVTLLEQFDTARDAMKGGCGSMSSVVDGTLTNGNATTITGTTISHRDVNKDVTYAKKYTNKYISMNADEHLQQPRQLTESHPWPLASPCGRGDLLRELESFIARANVIDDVDVVEEDAATKDTTEDAAAAKTTNVVDTVEDMNTNFKDADSRLRIYTAIFHRLITAFPTSGPTLTRLERAYTRTLALIPRERSELRALQRQVKEVCGLDVNRREIELERVRGAGLEREVRELSALNVSLREDLERRIGLYATYLPQLNSVSATAAASTSSASETPSSHEHEAALCERLEETEYAVLQLQRTNTELEASTHQNKQALHRMELELAARTKALDTLRVQRRELSEVVGTGSTSSTSKGKKSVTVSDGIYPSALRT